MIKLNEIEVWFNNKEKIGIIKKVNQRPYTTSFRYDKQWIKNGFPISPFSLPLEDKEFIANPFLFDGIFGVFADSLPDSWGRLLENEILNNFLTKYHNFFKYLKLKKKYDIKYSQEKEIVLKHVFDF